MPRTQRSINSLLLAIALSAGVASPLALANETAQEDANTAAQTSEDQSSQQSQSSADRKDADYVAVRVSLPNGKSFTRLEPKRTMSARYNPSSNAAARTSRRASSGARVSVPTRSVSGGSNASSVKIGGSGGGGGGGSSSSSGGGGGGGGGGSSAIVSKGYDEGDGLDTGSRSGVFSFGNPNGSQGAPEQSNPRGSSQSNNSRPAVPTVGSPRFDRDGNATGGQRVEFHDAGMSAAVIGNRIYLNNVELVSADQPFEIITGTRLGHDSAIMESGRLSGDGVNPLSSFNTGSSSIKLEFESDTTVTLMLYTQSSDEFNPERDMRSWTVRVR